MIRTAKTENGWVRGIEAADPRITAFKGIPFAAPPVGKNRWRAPQPCKDWEGVRDASRFAPISVQDTPGLGTDVYCREWHVDPEIPMNEDCLYLNIWTGAKTPEEGCPVLVWYFGGGLQWGYPAEMEFDGERLARRGVVVVTVNYRINAFGFLAHPQLSMEQPDAPTNFGSLDQQAGLRWVKRNIAAFGGDPDNITIAGQSAGGGSVMSQMTCEENYGLFQKAVVMSALISNPEGGGPGAPQPLYRAEENGRRFFEFLGVSNLEEARELDAFYIRDRYAEFRKSNPMMTTVQDNRFCCGNPMVLFAEGRHAPVPVMAGNTADEFPESRIEEAAKALFLQNRRNGLEQPCYYYRFDADIPGWDQPGTFHSVDLWFFFETLAKCWRPFTGRHYDLARQMCNYWANFIKTGDPNGADADGTPLPGWMPYTREAPCEMVFTGDGAKPSVAAEPGEKKARMEALLKGLLKTKEMCAECMVPVWRGERVYRETFAMLEENGKTEAPFLYAPREILRAESYDGKTVYEEGRDFVVKGGSLVLTADSRIARTPEKAFYYDSAEEAEAMLKRPGAYPGFGPVTADDGRYLMLDAVGHPEAMTKWQIAVTYTTEEKWTGAVPEDMSGNLTGLKEKLKKKEPLRIVLYGDSISCGFDCSGMYGQKPGQPVWAELVLRLMREKWDSPVRFRNTSVGGVDTEWAIRNASRRVCAHEPDLVLLGFGMNDRCSGDEYREKMRRLMDAVRRECPGTEFLLIGTTLPNPLLHTPPLHFCARQEEYGGSLRPLCGPGTALADVGAVQRELMKKKRYMDLTGNLLNHPNDYLARIQAQTVAAALGLLRE